MNKRNFIQGLFLLCAIGALTLTASAQTSELSGHITIVPVGGARGLSAGGGATVNGANAISGATVFSDSTVTTAKGSSAVVSLGKLGRVEIYPDTNLKLSFTDTSITVSTLDQGRVRISSSSGVNASVTTSDGEIVSSDPKKSEFIVDVTCGNTFVAVLHGRVELRAGSTVKQIAAGNQDTAGTARPGCTPSDRR